MKTKVSIILVCLTMMASSAYATVYNGTCGENVVWEYNDSSCVLRITGEGSMTNNSFRTYASSIKRVEIGEGVTSVCTSAFSYSFTQLDTVVFASSVDSVGE